MASARRKELSNDPKRARSADSADRETVLGYSEDERLLNEYLRHHPMLNTETTNREVLQKLCNMIERAPIRVEDVPVVPKSYEDQFLRSARHDRGERSCVLGDQCLGVFVAKVRYGVNTTRGFVCTEFLLPLQREAWLDGKGLPDRPGKCLQCQRYYTTYVYLTARSDPEYGSLVQNFGQTHTNPVAPSPLASGAGAGRPTPSRGARSIAAVRVHAVASGDVEWHDQNSSPSDLPSHTNTVDCVDGYRRDKMLFVDEDSLTCPAMRGPLSRLPWRPYVRFSTLDYKYVDVNGESRIVQIGVGADEESDERASTRYLNWCPPFEQVERTVGPPAARA